MTLKGEIEFMTLKDQITFSVVHKLITSDKNIKNIMRCTAKGRETR